MDPRPAIRVFLLSPASLSGVRGRRLLDGGSGAPFAGALADGGAPIGDVYEFVSSLYFRGKRAYAEAFARPPAGSPGALVITSALGLVPLDRPVTAGSLAELASVAIDPGEPRYVEPLLEGARALAERLGPSGRAVLLGSLASPRYVEPLLGVLGRRLMVPEAFVGRGDMSRGGLMLRAVDAGEELTYVVAADAERTGKRPPRLEPR